MNSDSLIQLLQTSVRVTLGATTSLIEVLQDPTRRDENLTKLREEWARLADEWEEKGASTEQEARSFVNQFFKQRGSGGAEGGTGTVMVERPVTSPEVQVELQELTAQIAAIRAELEKLRNPE